MSDTILEKQIFDKIVEKLNLQEIVCELPPEKLAYDAPLFESMDPSGIALDSIDSLELVVLLQENFNVTVKDEEMGKLTSVANIAEFIRSKQA